MNKRSAMIVFRSVFGLLTLVAIAVQLVIQIQTRNSVVNFFSFFTNLSNLFIAVVLLLGATMLLNRREPRPRDDLIRGAAVLGMVIVGVVFSVLLRDVDLGNLQPWINTVLHYIMPVVAILDWLILPPKSHLTLRQLPYWLIFPLIYLAYTLIRGPIAKFYPYPFLNPAHVGGYGVVALYCVAIFIAFLVVGWLLMLVGNWLTRAV